MSTVTEPTEVFRYADPDRSAWGRFIEAMHSGRPVEIDEEMFYYWLEVLPPRSMGATYVLDGQPRKTSFGFCEGSDIVTAFWREKEAGAVRHFCQRTDVMSRGY